MHQYSNIHLDEMIKHLEDKLCYLLRLDISLFYILKKEVSKAVLLVYDIMICIPLNEHLIIPIYNIYNKPAQLNSLHKITIAYFYILDALMDLYDALIRMRWP